MKFAPVPQTTRNVQAKMGLTQPVFPKVNDHLGQTAEKSLFQAVTDRDDENMTAYEGASISNANQVQSAIMAELALPKNKRQRRHRRQLDPII